MVLLVSFLLAIEAKAVDLGKRAASFEIKEEGFVAMMMRKLQNVDLEAERKKMEMIAVDRVNNPPAVSHIVPAREGREYYYDPAFTLKKDIVLPCGKVLHKAGTRVNPLDHMQLERRLLFLDAREGAQIAWLKEMISSSKEEGIGGVGRNAGRNTAEDMHPRVEDRIILVGGSPLKLQEELKMEVYFDQAGELTSKFGIKASPAIVVQEGRQLKIEEINLNERN